jgi:hypothetical protein
MSLNYFFYISKILNYLTLKKQLSIIEADISAPKPPVTGAS